MSLDRPNRTNPGKELLIKKAFEDAKSRAVGVSYATPPRTLCWCWGFQRLQIGLCSGRLDYLTRGESFALARAGKRNGRATTLPYSSYLQDYKIQKIFLSLWIGAPVSAVGLNIFQGPFLHHEGCRCILACPLGWQNFPRCRRYQRYPLFR